MDDFIARLYFDHSFHFCADFRIPKSGHTKQVRRPYLFVLRMRHHGWTNYQWTDPESLWKDKQFLGSGARFWIGAKMPRSFSLRRWGQRRLLLGRSNRKRGENGSGRREDETRKWGGGSGGGGGGGDWQPRVNAACVMKERRGWRDAKITIEGWERGRSFRKRERKGWEKHGWSSTADSPRSSNLDL